MRRVALLAVAATLAATILAVACGADPVTPSGDDGEPRRGGGWDANSGSWNGNMGTWGTIAGIGGNPPWAPNGTGAGTLTNYQVTGLRWVAPLPTSACGMLTAGVDRVRFLSSTRTGGSVTGPDVEVERAGDRAPLAMGDTVSFHAEAVDGTLAAIPVTVRVRRVDTLGHADAPAHQWPVFELELCEHLRADRGYAHLGYVSWAPMMVLPERPDQAFTFPAGIVQPVTTIARAEYRDNPAVPPSVQRQGGALLFKFAFYASLPVALADEPALAFTTSRGASLSNAQVLVRGAIALGNGGWVTMPDDPGQHQFLGFFTRTGTPASMFALARGDGSGPAELKQPAAWNREEIPALQLTAAELMPQAAGTLDAVHALAGGPLAAGDVWAHGPSQLGHGESTQRHGYYLGGSGNNLRMVFFAQLRASTERARWGGLISGRVTSQAQLAQLMMRAEPQPLVLIAAESPPPPGKDGFESPGLGPMPPDSPVYADPPDIDAGIDAPADATDLDAAEADAAMDAAVDAAVPDDAALMDADDTDAAVPMDAGLVDADDTDAAVPMDAGLMDADDTDAAVPMDAGLPDADLVDAGLALQDANQSM